MGQRFCGFSTPIAGRRTTAVWTFGLASTLLLSATGSEGKTALLIIDVQNDFLPGGSLAVKEGPVKVVPVINELLDSEEKIFDYVLASQDWHPKGHVSFASAHNATLFSVMDVDGFNQTMWPDHCVQNSTGAELAPDLNAAAIDKVVYKGTDPKIDSYSVFYDNRHVRDLGTTQLLKDEGVDTVYLVGVATDYCVKYSALDAVADGFKTYVITDAVRGVDAEPGDIQKALDEMASKGVKLVTSAEVLGSKPAST